MGITARKRFLHAWIGKETSIFDLNLDRGWETES
jgi:hypothetical protein